MPPGGSSASVASESRPDAPSPVETLALHALVAEYFHRVDRPEAGDVTDLFTDDATLMLGSAHLTGRAEIAAFFEARAATHKETQRLTRHLSGPLSIAFDEMGQARVCSTVVVYAGTGALPLPAAVPTTICDFEDVCTVNLHGQWRFQSRRATLIFVGAGAAPFAK